MVLEKVDLEVKFVFKILFQGLDLWLYSNSQSLIYCKVAM